MTKILKPLQLDIYIFKYSVMKGSANVIGIGPIIKQEIKTHHQAFILIAEGLHWKIDIFRI
jgi:hypothetical protein